MKLRVLDLFAGIGGFSLGLERTGGFETVAFCEIEPFPQKVLRKHWPEVPIYEDVRELTAAKLAADGITVDVITGGFPCQDISTAGKQAGIADGTRSGLWSECARLVSEIRPQFAIFENVANLLRGPPEQPGGWFSRILCDLSSLGYDAEWENIPASALGASHRRERIWIVAYPTQVDDAEQQTIHCRGEDRQSCNRSKVLAHANRLHEQGIIGKFFDKEGRQKPYFRSPGPRSDGRGWWPPEPDVGRVANGVPGRTHRLAALGNAVVPQIPELIGHAILESINNSLGDGAECLASPVSDSSFHVEGGDSR